MGIVPEWLAPLDELFDGLETALQDQGKTDVEVIEWIEAAARQFPDQFENMDLEFIAHRLEAAMSAAVQAGIQRATSKTVNPEP